MPAVPRPKQSIHMQGARGTKSPNESLSVLHDLIALNRPPGGGPLLGGFRIRLLLLSNNAGCRPASFQAEVPVPPRGSPPPGGRSVQSDLRRPPEAFAQRAI